MPRIARIVGTGYPHHVVQRGNNREKVFLDKEDYREYLSYLEKYSSKKKAVILVYCLMSNHVHLLVRPSEENSLSKMMQGIALCYTQYFNRKYKRTGRLWECRYHSTVIDEETYLWAVSKYIENNPVRAKVVREAEDYRFSSARAHLLGETDPLLKEILFDEGDLKEYARFIKDREDKEVWEEIRRNTRLGKPLGDGKFIQRLSKRLGHYLVFRPKGRPRRKNVRSN